MWASMTPQQQRQYLAWLRTLQHPAAAPSAPAAAPRDPPQPIGAAAAHAEVAADFPAVFEKRAADADAGTGDAKRVRADEP